LVFDRGFPREAALKILFSLNVSEKVGLNARPFFDQNAVLITLKPSGPRMPSYRSAMKKTLANWCMGYQDH